MPWQQMALIVTFSALDCADTGHNAISRPLSNLVICDGSGGCSKALKSFLLVSLCIFLDLLSQHGVKAQKINLTPRKSKDYVINLLLLAFFRLSQNTPDP